MEKMQIVNLCDYPQYVELVGKWIYSEFIEDRIENCTLQDILDSLKQRKKDSLPMTFIALLGDVCVGTVSLFDNDLATHKELSPWLAALLVDKEHRNSGYGKLLIDHAVGQARQLDVGILYLRTESAVNYYPRLGWERCFSTMDEHGYNTVVFKMDLSTQL